MEIILLWLDDLEDLILICALALEKWRIALLQIGLLAAVGLQSSRWFPELSLPELTLAGVASASVAAWIFGLLVRRAEAHERARVSLPA